MLNIYTPHEQDIKSKKKDQSGCNLKNELIFNAHIHFMCILVPDMNFQADLHCVGTPFSLNSNHRMVGST